MITLPLEFDTTRTWQTIARYVQLIGAALVLAAGFALLSGNVRGALGVGLILMIVWFIVRRIHAAGFSMGAAGTVSAAEVTTRPVKVLWYALPVPSGRFPIDRFESIAIVEYPANPQRPATRTTGSVELVGKAGTPNIRVAYDAISSALEFGAELGSALALPHQRVDAPGTRSIHIALTANR